MTSYGLSGLWNLLRRATYYIFAIRSDEIKKFLSLSLMQFCVLFNYTLLRTLKDTLVIGDPRGAAEVVHFIKPLVVFPSAILFVSVYNRMRARIENKENMFYYSLAPFIIFFSLFAYVIFPARDYLHPSEETIQSLTARFPAISWIFPLYSLWSFAIFYGMAETWGAFCISFLFWQFANQITQTEQAKRFYPMFGVIGQLGLIAAGSLIQVLFINESRIERNVIIALSLVVICAVLMGVLHYYISNDKDVKAQELAKPKKKEKVNFWDGVYEIINSRYLLFIVLLVVSYNVSINLVEITWKGQMKALASSQNEYAAWTASLFIWTGIMTLIGAFASRYILQNYSWYACAILTPLMLGVTSILFYMSILLPNLFQMIGKFSGLSFDVLKFSVVIGFIQNVASKATKYVLFDPTKEMAYIPLDDNLKVKGKSAIDVVGNRLSKASGSYIQAGLLFLASLIGIPQTQRAIAPVLCILVLFLIFIWLYAVNNLSQMYQEEIQKKSKETV